MEGEAGSRIGRGLNLVRIESELLDLPVNRLYFRDWKGRCEVHRDAASEVRTSLAPNQAGVSRPAKPRASRFDHE